MSKTKCILLSLLFSFAVQAADALHFAQQALEDKLFSLAEKQAERILKDPVTFLKYKDRTQALDILLNALAAEKRFDVMLQKMGEYESAIPKDSTAARFAYWRALAQLGIGNNQAVADMQVPPDVSPKDAESLRRVIVRGLVAIGNYKTALPLFSEIAQKATDRDVLAENAAEWAAALKNSKADLNEMQNVLDAALRRLPDSGSNQLSYAVSALPYIKGQYFLDVGKTNEAVEIWQSLANFTRADPSIRVDACLALTRSSTRAGDIEKFARLAVQIAVSPVDKRRSAFTLGKALLNSVKGFNEGITVLKTAIRENLSDPASMEAQFLLADKLFQLARYEDAIKEFRLFTETFDDPALINAADARRAEALIRLGQPDQAIALFRRLAENASTPQLKTEYLFREADALHTAQKYVLAAEQYKSLASAAGITADAKSQASLMAADSFYKGGQTNEAVELLNKLIESNPPAVWLQKANLYLAELLVNQNKLAEAEKLYTTILSKEANQPDLLASAHLGRGRIRYRLFKFKTALEDFTEAARLAPSAKDEAAFYNVLALYGNGNDDEARAAGAAYLLDYPNSLFLPDMAMWLAQHDFNRGNYDDAKSAFLSFVTKWPENKWAEIASLWAARASLRQRDYAGAIELLSALITTYPNTTQLAEARYMQAESLIELARLNEALVLLDDIIARYPESEWAANAKELKGDCLLNLGADNSARYLEAIKTYKEILARPTLTQSQIYRTHFKIGRCFEKLNRADEALEHYYIEVVLKCLDERKQTKLDPDTESLSWFLKAAYHAADLLDRSNKSEEALQILRRISSNHLPGTDIISEWMKRIKQTDH